MSKRNIEKHILFNAEEWAAVCARAEKLGKKAGTYIREISVQGVIKFYDVQELHHLILSFNRIGREINQIAKVVNSTGSVYQKDVEELAARVAELEDVFDGYLSPLEYEELMDGD